MRRRSWRPSSTGADDEGAVAVLDDHQFAAPHLMPIEVADILRSAALADDIKEPLLEASWVPHGCHNS